MTIGLRVVTALQAVAGGRVHPVVAPEEPTLPYVTYLEAANPTNNALEGASNLQNTRLQIDCWSLTYSEAHSVADAVTAAMLAQSHLGSPSMFDARLIGRQDFEDPDVRTYRVLLEFSCWHLP